MAEIKVQKKSALPWWAWLLLGLLAIGLIWWLISRFGDNEETDEGRTDTAAATQPLEPAGGAGSTPAAAGAPVTDLAAILSTQDQATLAGRDVRLDGVPVQDMVGDAAFWIGPGADRRVLVILDEQIPSPPPTVEGRVNVNAGQTVNVRGRVRAAGDLPTGPGLEPREREAAAGQQVYIWADTAEVATPVSAAPAGPPGRR